MADDQPQPSETPGHAPSGASKQRACAKCAKLKMKCHWPASGPSRDQEACIRCARMKLNCHIPDSQPRKKRVTYTRVAQLEQKLEGLVSLLSTQSGTQSTQSTQQTPQTSLPPTPDSNTQARASNHHHHQQHLISQPHRAPPSVTSQPSPSVPTSDWNTFEALLPSPLTWEDANSYLQEYRTRYMPRFPFVVISADTTAQSLHADAPCLFFTIQSIAAPLSAPSQFAFKDWFRRYIAEHVVVKQEKTLELLQAILVHLAWGDFHHFLDLQITTLLQLAGALISDLRLDRKVPNGEITAESCLADAWTKIHKGSVPKMAAHTVDEKRAVLGYQHHASLLATLFRRGPLLLDSNYLKECCDVVEAGRERDSDIDVVVISRLQVVSQRADAILSCDWSDKSSDQVVSTAVLMSLMGFDREMQEILQTQPSSVQQRPHIRVIYHVLRARLFEPVLSTSPGPSLNAFPRGEALTRCLDQNAKYYSAHALVPPLDIGIAPFTFGALAAFTVVTSSRLLLMEESLDWDPPTARKRLDLAVVLQQLSQQLEDADRLAQEQGRTRRLLKDGTAVIVRYAQRLRWIRQWYVWKTEGEVREYGDEMAGQHGVFDPGAMTGGMNLDMPMNDGFWDVWASLDPSMLANPDQTMVMPQHPGPGPSS